MGSLRLRPPLLIAAFVSVAVLSGVVSGAVVAFIVGDGGSDADVASPQPSPARGANAEMTVQEVAARAILAVVSVLNEGESRVDESGLTVETVSSGSGVIIDEAGFVVTNEHVVHEPGTLSVVLESGEQRPAVVVSHDAPFTDLAVLQIPEGGLEALPLGDSDELQVGQTVLAIGSALFEYRNTISTGIVSGLDRRYLRGGVYLEDLIQTDAAVNTGNSGGPLVTLDGRMVGLVSNVVRRIEGAETVQGISFAISSRTMAPIIESIVRTGSFPRPYFGVEHIDLDVPTAAEMGLSTSSGALVQTVLPGSPAAAAGIQVGDVITGLGPAAVDENFTFLNALGIVGPSDRIPVQVVRNNETLQFAVQLVPRE